MNLKNRGFTLIELLVVIAIIGVLSAVVLSQLNSARDKAFDAAAKAAFKNLSTPGVFYYENNGNYNAICNDNSAANGKFNSIWTGVVGATCYNAALGYKVKVQLKVSNQFNSTSGTDWLCADTTGNIKVVDIDPGTGGAVPC